MDDMKKQMVSVQKTRTATRKLDSFNKADNFLSLVIVIFSILFIVSYVRSLFGASDLTFTSFLEFIQSVPQVSFSNTFIDMTILGDWGIFEFLRQFINIFTNILSVLIFLFGGLVQLIMYLVYLLRYLFLI